MRAFGDFACLDLVQGVYPLSISINGVHEMHAVRRSVSGLIERPAREFTLVGLIVKQVELVLTGEKFKGEVGETFKRRRGLQLSPQWNIISIIHLTDCKRLSQSVYNINRSITSFHTLFQETRVE